MKQLLALGFVLVASLPAQAHFIWLLPPKQLPAKVGDQAQMIFSDNLEPDGNVDIAKIKQTKLFVRSGKGELTSAKIEAGKNHYQVIPESKSKGAILIGGVCQYGVITKGKSDPFLLMYYPQTFWPVEILRDKLPTWRFESSGKQALEIVPTEKAALKVLWQGKPAANLEVTLFVPGLDKNVERKTDESGLVKLEVPKAGGYYGVLARKVESKEGKLDDKTYKEIRHYATFTLFVPGRVNNK
jgi:uncharacterized GH25 family protein